MYDKNEDDDLVVGGDRVSQQIRAELERWQKDNREYLKYRQEIDNVVGNDNNDSNEPTCSKLSAFGGRPASNTPLEVRAVEDYFSNVAGRQGP